MSAYTQNYPYVFGRKIPGAKENKMTDEELKRICESASKYLNEKKDETQNRTAKQ